MRELPCRCKQNWKKYRTCFSMDMHKVLMLLHLPGIKMAQFTRWIVMINQSIIPLEFKNCSKHKPKGYLWHEGIQGRKDEDVASVVWKFLSQSEHRDCKNIRIWRDNLSTSEVLVEIITLKYFGKGHTFTAADSFHHQVEEVICMI